MRARGAVTQNFGNTLDTLVPYMANNTYLIKIPEVFIKLSFVVFKVISVISRVAERFHTPFEESHLRVFQTIALLLLRACHVSLV